MNGEVEVLKTTAIAFPQTFGKQEVVENIIVEEKIAAETTKTTAFADKENRFARLKKHLRKRSASIL
ncbi:MAG: hypothetical protein M3Q99_16655 [Acidobacteriota bacterium]|nr:hypothetical protein [Acidobacteriota bacterium]